MKRFNTRVPGSIQKMRLDEYLAEWLPQAFGEAISRGKIRNLIVSGAVYVNRHRNKLPMTSIYSGAYIEVYYDPEKVQLGRMKWDQVRIKAEDILFEDEWLIVANKSSGVPTQPTLDPSRPNLFDLMKTFLEDRDQVQTPYVGLHHRLDKDTSGLVLFTKKEEANLGVSKLFSEHQIEKTYHCLSWRSPNAPIVKRDDVFQIENYLGKISEKNETSRFGEVSSGGDFASTGFKVLQDFRDVYWLQARPKTGRTHQIRVHCSEWGAPILGDPIYFPEGLVPFMVAPRLMLHAFQLHFTHPLTGEPILVEAPLAEEFVQLLGTLKK